MIYRWVILSLHSSILGSAHHQSPPLNNYLLTIELIRDIHQLDLCIHGLGPEDISNKLVTFEYPAPAPH